MIKTKIKRILKTVFILCSLASLSLVPWILVKAWILPLPDTVQEQLNEAIDHGFDGIIVYVNQAGSTSKTFTAGWHDPINKIAAKPDALFKIASINKLYTAAAIAKLVANGQLSLEESLSFYLPEMEGKIENADKITLKMLVEHRSGIPNFTNVSAYWAAPKESNEEKLELIYNLPADFQPNDQFSYCNTNYVLLTEIMNRKLGSNYFQFIQEKILDRLGLKNTFASVDEINIEEVMSGFHVGHPLDLKTDHQGMISSAEDVGLFLRALNDGTLFDQGEMEIYSSIYNFNHTGLIPGYQSIAKYHKDLDAVVIQFTGPSNFEGYNWNLSEIVYDRVIQILEKNTQFKE